MTSRFFIQLLSLLTFTLTVNAQIDWSDTYNLSNTSFATSDYHSVYTFDFNYFVVWGDNGEIKFKSSSDMGQTWSANVTVSNTPNTCGWPVVGASSHQNIFILYHTLATGGIYEVIFQKSTNGGSTWSPMQKISGNASAITPQMVVSGFYLHAVWEERPNNNYEIYFSTYSILNDTWTIPQNISNTATTSRWVQLQGDWQNLYCAWIETTTYPLSDIYFTKSSNGGIDWTTPTNITNDDRPQNRINMKYDLLGNLYIASDDIITFNFDEIFLLSSSDFGETWSTPVNITNNAGNSNTPCIEVFGSYIYFTWSDNTHSAPAYDNSDIFFKWSSDAGVTWQDSINLSVNSETSSRPRICYAWDGPLINPFLRLTVAWYDYSLGAAEILARNGIHTFIPVELTSFTYNVIENDVTLNWITASELNNRGFEIEKSKVKSQNSNLMDWEKLGFVDGNGTTTEIKHYSFTDFGLTSGTYQYRLKQIDFDGTSEYSSILTVQINFPEEFSLEQNYPNPFNSSTKIKYAVPSVETLHANRIATNATSLRVTLKVYDILGNEVAVLVNEEQQPGIYEVDFDAASDGGGLSSGVYCYRIEAGSFLQTKKMILLR
ncbi:MAG: T9SS type A sorting domain-containing protein [Ignavibacteriaceae bacterium]